MSGDAADCHSGGREEGPPGLQGERPGQLLTVLQGTGWPHNEDGASCKCQQRQGGGHRGGDHLEPLPAPDP